MDHFVWVYDIQKGESLIWFIARYAIQMIGYSDNLGNGKNTSPAIITHLSSSWVEIHQTLLNAYTILER
jgi:hypothetical protein